MAYHYYLGPWRWDAAAPEPGYAPPLGTVGCLDLATPAVQSMVNPAGRPVGFFAVNGIITDSAYAFLGSGDCREIVATPIMRGVFQSLTGYRPGGDHLVDLLWDLLTAGGDPDGGDCCLPLLPGALGRRPWLELHLGGHGCLRAEPFKWGVHPHRPKVQRLLRKHFEELHAAAQVGQLRDAQHHRRVLDFWCERYDVDDWREFVAPKLWAHVPGRLKHDTTITESFNKADSGTLGPDLTWTELNGNIDIVSNKAQSTTLGSFVAARADSDLSGTDQYAQAVVNASEETATAQVGCLCRKTSGATSTFYWADGEFDTNLVRLLKRVSGTNTTLGTSSKTLTAGTPGTVKVEAVGSAIKAYWNSSQEVSVTDTSITTGTRCGVRGLKITSGNVTWDDFEAADVSAGNIVYTQLERNTRGIARGLWQGFRR
jgi:hypothetical protein